MLPRVSNYQRLKEFIEAAKYHFSSNDLFYIYGRCWTTVMLSA
jgi:hypothetical protein